jgi:hypothetical protein
MDERKKTDEMKRRREKMNWRGSQWELYCHFFRRLYRTDY